jgi:hypothetical protein
MAAYDSAVVRSAAAAALAVSLWTPLSAHDFERTQVAISFARAGSYVVEVTNDTAWLQHRLIPFGGNFIDRVVLFVDGREIRPTSAEFMRGDAVSTYRLRGGVPADARTLRWYYGLVIDPYPLTIRRADGHLQVEEVAGDAWSRTIDISGQFQPTSAPKGLAVAVIIALLLAPVAIRVVTSTRERAVGQKRQDRRERQEA